MKKLFFNQLFTGDRWFTEGLTLELDAQGTILALQPGAQPADATLVSGVALPGMPNLHSHAHQRAMAGLAENAAGKDNFWSWRKAMYRQLGAMQPDHLQAIASQLYLEMLKAGYTSVAEFQYLHHDSVGRHYRNKAEMTLACLHAARNTGIGITCLPVLYGYGGFGGKPVNAQQKRFYNTPDHYLDIHALCEDACADDDNAWVGIAPHSLRAIDAPMLGELLQAVTQGPVHIHIAEQTAEVETCLDCYGMRPVQWLLDNADLNERWCLIHATHLSDDEIRALAGTSAVVGLCPSTEANLGDGFFPARDFFRLDGHFGIGSDSHISMSPVEEIRWLEYGQRLLHRQRNVLAPQHTGASLFTRALAGGSQAMGRKVGRLEAGYRADIVVLDGQHPILLERVQEELLDSWIFSGNSQCISQVFIGGEHVIKDGRHPHEATIYENYSRVIKHLLE